MFSSVNRDVLIPKQLYGGILELFYFVKSSLPIPSLKIILFCRDLSLTISQNVMILSENLDLFSFIGNLQKCLLLLAS